MSDKAKAGATNAGPGATQNLNDAKSEAARQLKLLLSLGLLFVALLVAGIGGWAATAQISGAVVGSGTLVVESNVKRVQHVRGGIVSSILVRNGDVVKGGQVLVRLDDTQVRAALSIITTQIFQLEGRTARLKATRDSLTEPQFPEGFSNSSKEAAKIATGERALYLSQVTSLNGRKAQLTERIKQLEKEIDGLKSQSDAKATELDLIRDEKTRIKAMFDRKLIPATRLLAIKRDVTRIEGEHGALNATIAGRAGQINETRLQILSLTDDASSNAQEQLRETEARIAELKERAIAAQDQLNRINITAPQSGVIHDLSVHTIGGVIEPARQIMLVVPQDDALHIDTTIAPNDIDQVHEGQIAKLRFSSFNQHTTPEVEGRVLRISADLKINSITGNPHFVARIALTEDAKHKLQGLVLVPGMPVETFIETAPRTALSYLVKPVTDNFKRAFRER